MATYLGAEPEQKAEGRSIILYGPPFSGKTSTLRDPSVKVLLGDMDHNTSPLDSADNVTIFPMETFEDYEVFRESVRRGYFEINGSKIPCDDFDIIAFDSFTRFEELIKAYVIKSYAPNRSRELKQKFGAQSDWADLQDIEVKEVRDWQAMTRTHGFNVIWIGHDMTVLDSVTKAATHIQLSLQGHYAAPRIMGAVDAVVYLNKVSTKEGIQRVVYTQDHQMIKADNRVPPDKQKLPPVLPLDKWSWSKILPYLGWKKVQK